VALFILVRTGLGKLLSLKDGRQAIVTSHPSFILRMPDKSTKQLHYERLVADFKLVAKSATLTTN
jgi:hypothetical protein